jgi:hypothetical protein
MPSAEIEKVWNDKKGKGKRFSAASRVRHYAKDMEEWGTRVRRDIIVLEHHIMELRKCCKMAGTPEDLFFDGDPGDPPPSGEL